jgi:hypothetical protein
MYTFALLLGIMLPLLLPLWGHQCAHLQRRKFYAEDLFAAQMFVVPTITLVAGL